MNTSFEHKNQAPTQRASQHVSQSTKAYPSHTIVRAKLEMTEPGDHDEQEADAVANTIVNGGKIARKISGGGGSSGIAVSQQMESQLSQLQGGGRQMPEGLRNMMESGFGQNFSHVRIHTDSEAASMSSSIGARAFTLGNDIYFNQGQFSPDTTEGQRLVAHELTHVVQGSGKVERKTTPTYLNSTNAMIDHLIKTATAPEGYKERENEEYAIVTAYQSNDQSNTDISTIIKNLKTGLGRRNTALEEKDKLLKKNGADNEEVKKKEEQIKTLESTIKKQINKLKSNEEWNSYWSKLWSFIMERNFVLTDGVSNSYLKDWLKNVKIDEETDPNRQEHALAILRRIFIRVQSGDDQSGDDIINIALEKEMEGIQAKELDSIINVDFIKSIQTEGRRTRDINLLNTEITQKKKRINELNKKQSPQQRHINELNRLKPLVTAMENVVAKMNDENKSSFDDALLMVRKETGMQEGISEEIEEVVSHGNKASLFNFLEKERAFMSAQGLSDDEVNQAINSKITEIIDNPDLCKIIFDDPHNTNFIDSKGNTNVTIIHEQLHKPIGPLAAWCDDFVHWCFLKAFDPHQFCDWGDKGPDSPDSIRNNILKYTMCENGVENEAVKIHGRVHDSIGLYYKNGRAIYNKSFNIKSIHNKFKADFTTTTKDEINRIISSNDTIEKKKERLGKSQTIKKSFNGNTDNASKWLDYMEDYLKLKHGQTKDSQPLVGDVFFLSGHIGIVTNVNMEDNCISSINTIEGNTNDQGSSDGNGVYKKTRYLNEILGYGRPDYENLRVYLTNYYEKVDSEKAQVSSQISPQETQSDTDEGIN